jgi:GYD domain
VEAQGAKVLVGGYSFGEYDVLVIFEAPDDMMAASVALGVAAGGATRPAKTTLLLSGQEWIDSLRKAQGVWVLAGAVTADKSPPGLRSVIADSLCSGFRRAVAVRAGRTAPGPCKHAVLYAGNGVNGYWPGVPDARLRPAQGCVAWPGSNGPSAWLSMSASFRGLRLDDLREGHRWQPVAALARRIAGLDGHSVQPVDAVPSDPGRGFILA